MAALNGTRPFSRSVMPSQALAKQFGLDWSGLVEEEKEEFRRQQQKQKEDESNPRPNEGSGKKSGPLNSDISGRLILIVMKIGGSTI